MVSQINNVGTISSLLLFLWRGYFSFHISSIYIALSVVYIVLCVCMKVCGESLSLSLFSVFGVVHKTK